MRHLICDPPLHPAGLPSRAGSDGGTGGLVAPFGQELVRGHQPYPFCACARQLVRGTPPHHDDAQAPPYHDHHGQTDYHYNQTSDYHHGRTYDHDDQATNYHHAPAHYYYSAPYHDYPASHYDHHTTYDHDHGGYDHHPAAADYDYDQRRRGGDLLR